MDLLLNEQQRMLQSTVQELLRRDFPKHVLASFDAGTESVGSRWEALASTGLLGSLVPEEYGGAGGTLADAAVVFEELGKGPVPGPHFSSGVLAALLVSECGSSEQKTAHLPAIVDGSEVFAVAITEERYGWEPRHVQATTTPSASGFTLDGVKLHVPDADAATHFLVAARMGPEAVGFFIVGADAEGVSVRPLGGFSTGLGEIRLDGISVGEEALLAQTGAGGEQGAWGPFTNAFLKATAVLSAYQVGGLDSVSRMCLEYSRTRHQFQQPIGRFQRVQDHIIDIVNHLDAARWTTYEALWKLDTGRPAIAGVHMAAALASEGYYLACNSAHDVHAGIGIVREYGLTLHTKMSRTLYHYLGDPRRHRREIARALDL